MFDFTHISVIDHHCHPYGHGHAALDPVSLARIFFHGMGDIPSTDPTLKPKIWGASDQLLIHFPYMGVAQTMVAQLSQVFGCPAELKIVAEERNRRTAESFKDYVKLLYDDARIVGTVLDTGLPQNDPLLDLIPGVRLRLFQMDPAIQRLLPQAGSYETFLRDYRQTLERAVLDDGFVGVKVHLAERAGFHARPISGKEAQSAFPAAKTGDPEAAKKIYVAIFTETLLQCQELDVPVHVHSGCTGGLWNGPISNADPILLADFLRETRFLKTRIVLLHAGYPWTKQAGQMAHTFPHVWVDMSQMTPWASLRIAECYRDVMAWAPLSKIVVGSGGHDTPEIAWLAAKTAKIALSEVLGDAVRMALMTETQAQTVAKMILHDNAARLYGMDGKEEADED